ncbi:MAG: glutamine--fructose-6-phosphate transaminase (isomerizing) [Dehalococcoidales bacterium]|jgi:glucosamine--fructose-6-phosphate aminotransferase (isomerizing)|nr:glutamine--fructose-6-phosphate transaminase (isomerizing) [Dehalococcoidales bacterium]MDP7415435.1 glutamine--fructose-6-phosphate transaminase (isomerizing) [Dehalococcoidales bacterium]
MCGIVGYIGEKQAGPILLNCLSWLECRGYDSCGIAVAGGDLTVYKNAVRVKALEETLPPGIKGTAGIGHTRWATHGEPSQVNAHPHGDCAGKIVVVHNGVINNFQKLRQQLSGEGHSFISETDTEVIPHLVEKYYDGDLAKAVAIALDEVVGSYAIIVMMAGEPGLVTARKDSPLIIGIGDRENYIASDVPAVLDYTNRVIYLEDDDIGVITADDVKVTRQGAGVDRERHRISWSMEDARKGGYGHFMLKEIHEQPKVIRDTIQAYLLAEESTEDLFGPRDTYRASMLLLACGTSYHAAMIGKYLLEELFGTPVRTELASEFNYHGYNIAVDRAIVITQSGETADVLKAMKRLTGAGCPVTAITNVMGSTASRMAQRVVYTRAGPEISVAATKSFIAQLMALYWLALLYSKIDISQRDNLVTKMRQLPGKVQQVLDNDAVILKCAGQLAGYDHTFFVGRGINFPVAMEGALKLKEISYIHAEGYAAGELKHGTFALLGREAPVVAVVAQDDTYEAMLTGIKEIKARHSPVIALVAEGDETVGELADTVITVPQTDAIFSPVVNTVALQLLAYYTAKQRGCPIDFPRNLAKSVTVD